MHVIIRIKKYNLFLHLHFLFLHTNVVWPGIKQIHLIYQHIATLVRFYTQFTFVFYLQFFIFTHTLVRSDIKQILQLINTLRLEACRAGFNTQFTKALLAPISAVRFFTAEECSGRKFFVRTH